MKALTGIATLGVGLLLSACQAVGPDYQLPQEAAVHREDFQGDLAAHNRNVVSAPIPGDWWRLYRDPRLDELVRQAMAANTDLRVAAANLARARAQVEEAESAGGWSGGVKLGAQRLQESGEAFLLPEKVPVANVGDIGITTSYQFDLFGTLQRGIEAAKANADATQAAADTARITLVADVVRAYTQVCAANEELEIAGHSWTCKAKAPRWSSACGTPGVATKPRSPAHRPNSNPCAPNCRATKPRARPGCSACRCCWPSRWINCLPAPRIAMNCQRLRNCCRSVTAPPCSSAGRMCVRPSVG